MFINLSVARPSRLKRSYREPTCTKNLHPRLKNEILKAGVERFYNDIEDFSRVVDSFNAVLNCECRDQLSHRHLPLVEEVVDMTPLHSRSKRDVIDNILTIKNKCFDRRAYRYSRRQGYY